MELADAVMDACQEQSFFRPLYDWNLPLEQRIERIAQEVYGADGVDYTSEARKQLASLQSRDDAASSASAWPKPIFPYRMILPGKEFRPAGD